MTSTPWVTTPIVPALLHGVSDFEQTSDGLLPHRVPAWARRQAAEPQLDMVECQPSGVRLVFTTRATAIELDALATRRLYVGMPLVEPGVYELVVDGQVVAQASLATGRTLWIDMKSGETTLEPGAAGTLRFDLPAGDKTVEIWLPHKEKTELVALRTSAPVEPVAPAETRRWVHHGSSISHGSNATRPTDIWPVVASRQAGLSLTNLGLGGSAMVDPFMARMMRDRPADLISIKLGINVVNGDVMSRRSFRPAVHGFLDTVREGQPDTPIVLVSPIYCPIHEETPGPSVPDMEAMRRGQPSFSAAGDPAMTAYGRLALRQVREILAEVVAERADERLFYLDGLELYGEADSGTLPLPDNLHPDGPTQRLMGQRFAAHPVVQAAMGIMRG